MEVSHCLTLMSGDMEKAAQLILHRQESGQSLTPTELKNRLKNGRKVEKQVDEKVVRSRILDMYGYVDQAEDARYHRPTLKKEVVVVIQARSERGSRRLPRVRSSEISKNCYKNSLCKLPNIHLRENKSGRQIWAFFVGFSYAL